LRDLHQQAATGKLASALLAMARWRWRCGLFIFSTDFRPPADRQQFFRSGEYYLGMFSGMIRFACLLLAALAL